MNIFEMLWVAVLTVVFVVTSAAIFIGIRLGFDNEIGRTVWTGVAILLGSLAIWFVSKMRTDPAYDPFEFFERVRRGPLIDPAAVDIILARAQSEPHLARAIGKSLRNAIRVHSSRNPDALQALDWIIRGSSMQHTWRMKDRTLGVDIEHRDFQIRHSRLYVHRPLLPDTVISGIDHTRLSDIIEIPLLRRDIFVEASDVRLKQDAVVFDVFRDRRDLEGVIEALGALERAHSEDITKTRRGNLRHLPI